MSKGLKIFLFALIGIAGLFFITSLFMPGDKNVERSIVINADVKTVFTLLNNPERMNDWSPWYGIDPDNTTYEFYETKTGVDAGYKWVNEKNSDVGTGTLKITKSEPDSLIETELWFEGQGTSWGYYKLEEVEGKTKVTWGLDMKFPLLGRIFTAFIDFEKILGGQFEEGLNRMKALVERENGTATNNGSGTGSGELRMSTPEIKMMNEMPFLSVRGKAANNDDAIGAEIGRALGLVSARITETDNAALGRPVTVWHSDMTGDEVEMENGIAVNMDVDDKGEVKMSRTPYGNMLSVVYTGMYQDLQKAHDFMDNFIAENEIEVIGPIWYIYLNDPGEVGYENAETEILYPVGDDATLQ